MLNKMKTWIAAAVLSGTVSANVQAATLPVGESILDQLNTKQLSADHIENLSHSSAGHVTSIKHLTVKPDETLTDIAITNHVSASQIKEWNHLITDFVYPGLDLILYSSKNMQPSFVINEEKVSGQTGTSVLSPTLSKAVAAAGASVPATAAKAVVSVAAGSASQPAAEEKSKPAAAAAPAKVEAVKEEPAISTAASKTALEPEPAKATVEESQPEANDESKNKTNPKEITVKATAYTASCEGCSGITATGVNIKDHPEERVIAVDPKVIPLGSKVYVEGFGEATAADTGGAIKGNRIDVFIPSEQEAEEFGVQHLKVKILN